MAKENKTSPVSSDDTKSPPLAWVVMTNPNISSILNLCTSVPVVLNADREGGEGPSPSYVSSRRYIRLPR